MRHRAGPAVPTPRGLRGLGWPAHNLRRRRRWCRIPGSEEVVHL